MALVEVVGTEVLIEGAALEQVIADSQYGVGDRDNCSLGSACGGKPTELAGQITFL